MVTYILRRLLLLFPTLIGMTAVVFFIMAAAPGGVGGALMSGEMGMKPQERQARREYLNRRFGLDKPAYIQYCRWLNKISPLGFATYDSDAPTPGNGAGPTLFSTERGASSSAQPKLSHRAGDVDFSRPTFKIPDLGESYSYNRPVLALVAERLPVTLSLNLLSFPGVYLIGIISGIYAARYRGKSFDIASGFAFLAMWSLPVIWVGVVLIALFANRQVFYWFDSSGLHHPRAADMTFFPSAWPPMGLNKGWLLDTLHHMVLPVICLSYAGFAFLSKLVRSSILENLSADFVRTARAKGLAERAVLFRHAFRNSLIPLLTVSAGIVPGLLAGSIVVESIFSIEGMGKLFVEAAMHHDAEVVLSLALVEGLLGLIAYLIVDLCYAVADPRVSYE